MENLLVWSLDGKGDYDSRSCAAPWCVVCYRCGATVADGPESIRMSIAFDLHACADGHASTEYIVAQDGTFVTLEAEWAL